MTRAHPPRKALAAHATVPDPAPPLHRAIDAEVERVALLAEAVALHREGKPLPEPRRAALVAAQERVKAGRSAGLFAPLTAGIAAEDADLALDCLMIAGFGLARPSRARLLTNLAAPGSTSGEAGLPQGLLHELLMPDGALEVALSQLLSAASPLIRGGLLRIEGDGPGRMIRPGMRLSRFVTGSEQTLTPPQGVRLAWSPGDPLAPLFLAAPIRRRLDEVAALIGYVRAHPDAGIAGPSVLFSGGPGTGKSLAVQHLAARLGRPLYQIDLGRVMSKWVGETERNMSHIFEALSGTEGLILIDEADALLGKRVEVREGRDQYANVTVSHTLALLERHRGPVFLTTNLRANFDTAYVRRFAAVVEFRRPDAPLRAEIWFNTLARMAAAGVADPQREEIAARVALAAPIDLTAAEIVNVAVVASGLAGTGLPAPAHLARAIWLERTKAGHTFTRTDLGALAPHFEEDRDAAH